LTSCDAFDPDAFGRRLLQGAQVPLAHAVFSARADTLTGM
jgi:hypothetical protein